MNGESDKSNLVPPRLRTNSNVIINMNTWFDVLSIYVWVRLVDVGARKAFHDMILNIL